MQHIFWLIWIVSMIWKLWYCIQCSSGNQSFVYSTSFKFSYSLSTILDILQSRYISSTGNAYHYMKVNNNEKTLLIKASSDDSIIWEKTYDVAPAMFMFDVSPDESSLYFAEQNSTDANFFRINATDGSILLSYKTTSGTNDFQIDSVYSKLTVSEDSSSVHVFSYEDDESFYCTWDYTQTFLRWIIYNVNAAGNYRYTDAIYAIDANTAFVTTEYYDNTYLEVRKFNFSHSSNYIIWASRLTWSSWSANQNGLLADSNTGTLYSAVDYGSRLAFFLLNTTDGAMVSGTTAIHMNSTCSSIVVFKMSL